MQILRSLSIAAALVAFPSVALADDTIKLKSGETVTGVVIGESTNAVTIKLGDGLARTVNRSEIDRIDLAPESSQTAKDSGNVQSHPGRGLWIGGLVTWITGYVVGIAATGAVSAATGGDVGIAVGTAAIPLVGPWIGFPVAAATNGHLTGGMIAGIVIDGVVQGTGFTMFVVGLTMKGPRAKQSAHEVPSVHVVPMIDGTTAGAAVIGRF